MKIIVNPIVVIMSRMRASLLPLLTLSCDALIDKACRSNKCSLPDTDPCHPFNAHSHLCATAPIEARAVDYDSESGLH